MKHFKSLWFTLLVPNFMMLGCLVFLHGCTEPPAPAPEGQPAVSRFVVVEHHDSSFRILRDTTTGRLYYQGISSNYAGFVEINQTPLTQVEKP